MWLKVFSFFLLSLALITPKIVADKVHGCGGFIKSHAEIDFSKVEVNLLTKSGVSKDRVDANPSNGYYFLPLYDKGEYILRVIPPPGWSFEPNEVPIDFDGESDPCSQEKDVNFVFKGFGITGKVEVLGQKNGAAGLDVELSKNGEVLKTVKTNGIGVFSFTPLLPGEYKVRASHPTWYLGKSETIVKVTSGNTALPDGSLQVTGFNIQGRVNEANVNFGLFIFAKKGSEQSVVCETKIPQDFTANYADFEAKPLCYTTAKNGEYIFKGARPGEYLILPEVKTTSTLHISPMHSKVVVVKDAVNVPDTFEITGFTVSGRVLTSPSGQTGVKNARIFVNTEEVTKTNDIGGYTLANIKAGTYTIQVKAEDLEFTDHIAQIAFPNPQIKDIFVSGFKVCGTVVSENSYTVAITRQGSSYRTEVQTSGGDWCTYLAAGKYAIEVLVSDKEKSEGVQFFPITQNIDVTGKLSGIVFSQLRAKVSGTVKCDGSCQGIPITLKPVDGSGELSEVSTSVQADGSYIFNNVLPGFFEISVLKPNFCWQNAVQTITIKASEETVPAFVQTGYSTTVISSHETQLLYKLQGGSVEEPTKEESLTLNPGVTTFCVSKPGIYDLKFVGCHTFDAAPKTLSTSDQHPISVTATKHKNGIRILSEAPNVYKISVESDGRKIDEVKLFQEGQKVDGYLAYRYDFDLAHGEKVKVTPFSGSMLFKPGNKEITGGNDCVDVAFNFIATKGLVLNGRTVPTIPDAKITLSFPKNPEMVSLETMSDVKGEFKFGPIDSTIDIELTAEKESYIFSAFDKTTNTFNGHKLCEIIASVKDIQGNKLSGVLLSLSGAESYRKNLITGEDGTIKFHSLSPSQYYLRPMMKEYKFEPSSLMIEVKNGQTEKVELSGRRVAFSTFGSVTTLNGEPFANVAVLAVASETCENHQEEAISESKGHYRIRGLLPGCKYTLRVKIDPNVNVDRSIPTERTLEVGQEDVQGINFIAMSPLSHADVIARIRASENDFYKTLKIALFRKDSDTAIHTQRVESPLQPKSKINPGIMVFFPRIPFDHKTYYIEVTTSLSDKNYKFTLPYVEFVSNQSNHFFEFDFKPEIITGDNEINQNSLPALFVIAIVGFVFFKQELALELLELAWNKVSDVVKNLMEKKKVDMRQEKELDEREIDELAKDINSIKKNKKYKKPF